MAYIKNILKKFIYGPKVNSESYIAYLRQLGMKIGNDVTIFAPTKTTIDVQYPWMIEIGDHVNIAQGAILLTHDYAWSVLKATEGGILGASGRILIGNNVFIGMNAIITRDVTIGDNVVIGAGSVVTKDCLPNSVYAGAPAIRIMDLDTFYKKRVEMQLREAKTLMITYYDRFRKVPPEDVFHEYFMLFTDVENAGKKPYCAKKMKLMGNPEDTVAYMKRNDPLFGSYKEFVDYCLKEVR